MNQPTDGPRSAAQRVAEARSRIECLSPDQVSEELEEGALLIDLREREELDQTGIISGSIHAPRGMLEFWADPSSPYHREIFDPARRMILYCASGGRSALAADLLQEMGYGNVAHLEGGTKAWKESGRSTEPIGAPLRSTSQA